MAVNEELKQMISDIKYHYKINQSEIADRLSVKATYLSDMINGRVPFNDVFKEKIYELYSDINPTSIQTAIRNDVVEEKEVVNYEVGIPYYNVDFINGFNSVEEITHQNPDYKINYPPANHCEFWVNATGDSMKGVIDNGDKIALKIVDKEWFPLGEVYAIITTNGHRMVKKITHSDNGECYKLVSANPDKTQYPDQDIPKRMIQTLFKVVTAIKFIN